MVCAGRAANGGWNGWLDADFLLVFAMSYVRDPARFDPLPRPKCMVLQVLVFQWLHMDRREVSEASVRGWAPWYALGGPRTVAGRPVEAGERQLAIQGLSSGSFPPRPVPIVYAIVGFSVSEASYGA